MAEESRQTESRRCATFSPNTVLDAVDDETKQKWMAMLLHNRYDCFGIAAIMCPVTKGIGRVLYPWIWEMDPHKDTHIPSRFVRSTGGADRRTQNGERNA
jgi:hypothetical protein